MDNNEFTKTELNFESTVETKKKTTSKKPSLKKEEVLTDNTIYGNEAYTMIQVGKTFYVVVVPFNFKERKVEGTIRVILETDDEYLARDKVENLMFQIDINNENANTN